jgi:hypothetical protein
MKFFFHYPSLPRPVGGSKQIRLQVQALCEAGFDACLLRDSRFFSDPSHFDDNQFYGIDVAFHHLSAEQTVAGLTSDDVVVVPEYKIVDFLMAFPDAKCRIGVNNQNGFACMRSRFLGQYVRRIEFAMANAPYVAELSALYYRLSPKCVFQVPHWILRPPFALHYQSDDTAVSICYMPRKIPEITSSVIAKVKEFFPEVSWIPIHMLPEVQVASLMRQNKVFFAAHDKEGCPMTALEAMASGAIVSGFPGTEHFRHPYASEKNGFWAQDYNINQAVRAVCAAIQIATSGGAKYQNMVECGHETVKQFSHNSMQSTLVEMARTVQEGSYEQRERYVRRVSFRTRFLATQFRFLNVGPFAYLKWKAQGIIKRYKKPGFREKLN